jgi:xylulokinase
VEAIATASRKPLTSPETMRLGIGSQCHVTADSYLTLGFHLAAGSLVRWYRDQFGLPELAEAQRRGLDAYDLLTEAARSSPPGANGLLVLPHWSGAGTGRVPPLDPTSRGAIYGLTLAHTRADLTRAIFEGITYEARFIIESLENASIPIHSLVVTGGGAKSAFWLQLKADITGKKVTLPEVTETSLLGAAILAGVGCGIYPSPQAAVERVCRTVQVVEPNPTIKAAYDRAYSIYQALYPSASPIHARLAETR